MYTIFLYILLFFLYSFLGWCLEVLCKLVSEKKFVNRGFLIGPYCPIYGYGAILMSVLLQKYLDDPFTLFIMIVLICSVLEYFTSFFLEKIFHTRWWDYTKYRFNINGRICLETMIPFGLFGLLIMYKVTPFFLTLFGYLPHFLVYIFGVFLLIIYLIDNIIFFKIIKNVQDLSRTIQRKQILRKDATERITKLVRKQVEKSMKIFEKRLIHAFPHLQVLREKVKRRKK